MADHGLLPNRGYQVGRLENKSGLPVETPALICGTLSGGKYRLVTRKILFKLNIYTREATAATGPWKNARSFM
ncbi:MAG: hypothetical protein IPL12_21415 [Bacteroidetes bacterium]|nr:hypothetical protein [Bacteroidota bacterium]